MCLLACTLLAFALRALAQPELVPPAPRAGGQEAPNPPWLQQFIVKPGDDRVVIIRPNYAGTQVELLNGPVSFRFVRLKYSNANEMVLLFNPPTGPGGKPATALAPFIHDGVYVSRAGDNTLLVTARDENSIDQVMQIVKLLDLPDHHLILEILLVDSARVVQLPANPADVPLLDGLTPFLHHADTTIYRTFLDIPFGQQGVLDLGAQALPARGVLFSEGTIHPDDTVALAMRALPKGEGQPAPGGALFTVKNRSALLLNELLLALPPVEDPAGKVHNYYLFAGVNVCQDERVHLADGARPLRLFFDGQKQPQIISLRNVRVEALLPGGAWLEDTVTPPASWPEGLPPFAASPGLNALLATGSAEKIDALRKFIAAIDVPQRPLMVHGQFIRISEKALPQLGIERAVDGAWPLPYGDATLAGRIAQALQNGQAKMVMAPNLIVQPFGAGSVGVDDWCMSVEQAYTRGDGAVSLQLAPLKMPESATGNRDIPPLELPPGQPVLAAIYTPTDSPEKDMLLFVVKATPIRDNAF